MHKSTVYSIYCNGFRNIRGYYSIVADSRFVRIQRFAIKSRCVQNLAKNKKFFLFAAYTMSYTRSFVTHVSSSQNQVIKCTQGGICCTFVLPHKIPQIKCLWNYNLSISFFLVNLCTISNVEYRRWSVGTLTLQNFYTISLDWSVFSLGCDSQTYFL